MAHLAGALQIGHRADGFLDRHVRIDTVQVIQIDDLDTEPPQARIARLAYIRGTAVDHALGRVGRIVLETELGREHDAVASTGDGTTDQLFVRVRPVDVGGVEQSDARVERSVDRGDRFDVVALAVEVAHAHAAETDRRYRNAAAAELACAHRADSRLAKDRALFFVHFLGTAQAAFKKL